MVCPPLYKPIYDSVWKNTDRLQAAPNLEKVSTQTKPVPTSIKQVQTWTKQQVVISKLEKNKVFFGFFL